MIWTTIAIKKETRELLQSKKLDSGESYESVILRHIKGDKNETNTGTDNTD